jgi:chromate transporter
MPAPLVSASTVELFMAFLRLGMTSFGGPVAHLEHLRREFVERRQWMDAAHYGQLLAVCQLLPGPASSQLGFGIGLLRGGWRGAVAASVGFTLPSVLLLLVFLQLTAWAQPAWWPAVVQGLQLVSVAVVAHGVMRLTQAFAAERRRALISALSLLAMLLLSAPLAQLLVIVGGAVCGAMWCRPRGLQGAVTLQLPYGVRGGAVALGAFGVLLLGALMWPASATGMASLASPDRVVPLAALGAAFIRAGALVFGGGHVVLPLLDASLVAFGWLTAEQFLTGYGAAQAVPDPLFSVAAYLGAAVATGWPWLVGAVVATVSLFAPGYLLLVAVLPAWSRIRSLPRASAVLAGINASVVGLLAAAWYDPILTTGVRSAVDALIAAVGFLLLLTQRSPLWVVAWCIGASVLYAAAVR